MILFYGVLRNIVIIITRIDPKKLLVESGNNEKTTGKKALSGIGIPVLNGFSVKCSDDAPSFILGDKIEQRMPSFEDRCNKYSKELAFRERFHESYDLSSGFECCKIIESAKDFLKTPEGLKTIEEKLKLVKTILPEKITISMLKDFKI